MMANHLHSLLKAIAVPAERIEIECKKNVELFTKNFKKKRRNMITKLNKNQITLAQVVAYHDNLIASLNNIKQARIDNIIKLNEEFIEFRNSRQNLNEPLADVESLCVNSNEQGSNYHMNTAITTTPISSSKKRIMEENDIDIVTKKQKLMAVDEEIIIYGGDGHATLPMVTATMEVNDEDVAVDVMTQSAAKVALNRVKQQSSISKSIIPTYNTASRSIIPAYNSAAKKPKFTQKTPLSKVGVVCKTRPLMEVPTSASKPATLSRLQPTSAQKTPLYRSKYNDPVIASGSKTTVNKNQHAQSHQKQVSGGLVTKPLGMSTSAVTGISGGKGGVAQNYKTHAAMLAKISTSQKTAVSLLTGAATRIVGAQPQTLSLLRNVAATMTTIPTSTLKKPPPTAKTTITDKALQPKVINNAAAATVMSTATTTKGPPIDVINSKFTATTISTGALQPNNMTNVVKHHHQQSLTTVMEPTMINNDSNNAKNTITDMTVIDESSKSSPSGPFKTPFSKKRQTMLTSSCIRIIDSHDSYDISDLVDTYSDDSDNSDDGDGGGNNEEGAQRAKRPRPRVPNWCNKSCGTLSRLIQYQSKHCVVSDIFRDPASIPIDLRQIFGSSVVIKEGALEEWVHAKAGDAGH